MRRPLEGSLEGARAALALIADDAIEGFLERHADPAGRPGSTARAAS